MKFAEGEHLNLSLIRHRLHPRRSFITMTARTTLEMLTGKLERSFKAQSERLKAWHSRVNEYSLEHSVEDLENLH